MRDLAPRLDGSTIKNSGETRLVISRLVSWSGDQKSPEVRQEASAAIRALFSLNPAQVQSNDIIVRLEIWLFIFEKSISYLPLQFAAALQELPKPFQEGANKALRSIDTDYGAGGDYRNESPEINKYPRSQSSMAGKIFHKISGQTFNFCL